MFGSWGRIIFTMSSFRIYSFSNMQRTVGYRHAEIPIMNGKPQSQFSGEELEEVSLELQFAAELGHNPRMEIDRLEAMARRGEAHYLVLGGRPVGRNPFKIVKWPQEWIRFRGTGRLAELKGTVQFREFEPPR